MTSDFDLDWVARQLGNTENRFLTVMSCRVSPAFDQGSGYRDLVAAAVRLSGGTIVSGTEHNIDGVWGLQRASAGQTAKTVQLAHDIIRQRPNSIDVQICIDASLFAVETAAGSECPPVVVGLEALIAPQLWHGVASNSVSISPTVERLGADVASLAHTNPEDGDCQILSPDIALMLAEKLDNLGPLKCLAQAASMLDRDIETAVLARLFNMDEARLAGPVRQLVDAGVLLAIARPTATLAIREKYRFAGAELRIVAYAQLPDHVRCRLHLRLGQILAAETPAAVRPSPCVVASHFALAGDHPNAFLWWCTAAEHAIAAASPRTAIEHLERALGHSESDPAAVSPEQQISALRLLGPLQAQLHGSGSAAMAATYARCLAIATDLKSKGAATAFDVLWGLQACHLANGAISTACETGTHLVDLARAGGQDAQLLLANQGLARLLGGDIPAALEHFGEVATLYDYDRHAHLRFRYASDQGAVALAHQSWAEAIAGHAARSEATSMAALDLAAKLDHAHTSAHVTCVLAARAQTLGEPMASAPLAMAGRAVAARHKFPYWLAWADIILGWNEGARFPAEGAARIDRAIEAYRSTGAGQALPYAFLLRAQLALAANDRAAAIAAAQTGWKLALAHGVNLYAAELLRVEAEARMPQREAQQLIGKAVRIARAQGAGLFERRAMAVRDKACSRPARQSMRAHACLRP